VAQLAAPEPTLEPVPAETRIVANPLWRRISEGLAALWLATVAMWWWSAREKSPRERAVEPPPPHKMQARMLKSARKAALAGDAATVKSALLDWARVQWPNDAPRSIAELAARVSMPLSIELDKLCSATYGPAGGGWDGEALARALRSFAVLDDDAGDRTTGDLPPLFPGMSA
jgi:hypothetical protein